MDPLYTVVGVFLSGFLGGLVGVVTGLGGASIATPLMTTVFGIPVRLSIATAFSATVATSVNGSVRYLREGLSDTRLGLLMAAPALLGVILGVYTNLSIDPRLVLLVFGLFLISMIPIGHVARRGSLETIEKETGVSRRRGLLDIVVEGVYYDRAEKRYIRYRAVRYWYAVPLMVFSGFIAGLLGIGGGAVNVIALENIMRVPVKVSIATSIFVIGYVGSVGSVLYWKRGFLDPLVAGILIPGIFLGSSVGSRVFNKIRSRYLQTLFEALVVVLGVRMVLQGLGI